MMKVITGIRRCGKSTLMELFQAELRLDGVPDSQIIAVNLEDFANIELRDPMKLHAYILSRAGNERAYVFLDEIQNVRDFPPMIDSLFLRKNLDLYLTGSTVTFTLPARTQSCCPASWRRIFPGATSPLTCCRFPFRNMRRSRAAGTA